MFYKFGVHQIIMNFLSETVLFHLFIISVYLWDISIIQMHNVNRKQVVDPV